MSPEALDALVAAGASAEMIAAAVKAEHAAEAARLAVLLADKRAKAAERQRRFKERKAASVTPGNAKSALVTLGNADLPNKEKSPTPPKEINPSNSEANASDASASPSAPVYTDSKHELWGEGIPILRQLGVNERDARSNVGRWLKSHEPIEVLGAIQRARDHRVVDPVPWITRALTPNTSTNGRQHGQPQPGLVAAAQRRIAELDRLEAGLGGDCEGEAGLPSRGPALRLLSAR